MAGAGHVELIGRVGELERLDPVLDRLDSAGAALLIVGAAGIGKSALVRHAQARADGLGVRTLSRSASQVERLSPSEAAELLDRDAPDLHPILRARRGHLASASSNVASS